MIKEIFFITLCCLAKHASAMKNDQTEVDIIEVIQFHGIDDLLDFMIYETNDCVAGHFRNVVSIKQSMEEMIPKLRTHLGIEKSDRKFQNQATKYELIKILTVLKVMDCPLRGGKRILYEPTKLLDQVLAEEPKFEVILQQNFSEKKNQDLSERPKLEKVQDLWENPELEKVFKQNFHKSENQVLSAERRFQNVVFNQNFKKKGKAVKAPLILDKTPFILPLIQSNKHKFNKM